MKRRLLIAIIGILTFNISLGQIDDNYDVLINEAWDYYNSKEYQKSANKYKEAFDLRGRVHPNNIFNAACTNAMAGDIELSYSYLFRLEKNSTIFIFIDYDKRLISERDLTILHKDKRWQELISLVKVKKQQYEEKKMKIKAKMEEKKKKKTEG